MKKVLVALVLILAVVGGATWYLFSNLDSLVKQAIETAGTDTVGSAVRVDSVDIDLTAGSASIKGFSIANPPGYSDNAMMSFDELSVVLDLNNLSRESLGITSIVARNPHVLYEQQGKSSNIDVVSKRFDSGAANADSSADDNAIQLAIGHITIDDIGASVNSQVLPQPVEVKLGNIDLQNLKGTPAEIANQIMRPVLAQLSRNAAQALLNAKADQLKDKALEQADKKIDELGDKLGNLLKRD